MTDFYCCKRFLDDYDEGRPSMPRMDRLTIQEFIHESKIDYCPYCGRKLSTL